MPRDDRPYLPSDSLLREVQRERTVALSGARALFMQAAHPVAFAGFFAHSASLDNPHPRLARTALAVNTVLYGTERQAREVQEIVGAMHARVRGRTTESVGRFPAGTPFRGDDPELLLWILAAFIDSSYRAYERYVRRLSPAEREVLWQQWRRVGEIFGLEGDAMPATYGDHLAYVRGMLASGDLVVSARARELSRAVILNPPIPPALFALKELVNQVTIDSLPADLRRQFGFLPVPGRGIAHAAFGEWMRRIGTPLSPDVLRHVPAHVMPRPGRDYADLVTWVDENVGRARA
ncbi:MAG: oxygenase MpaB family protein [Patulibacter minatonensis]